MKRHNDINCWIITEGMAGTENQCIGVAEALNVTPRIIQIGLHQPWKTLSPWLGFEQSWSFTKQLSPQTDQNWPDLVICAGRKAIAAARYIKKKSHGKSFITFLQNPKINDPALDLIAAPYHDKCTLKNAITTHGAPNKITKNILDEAYKKFETQFKPLRTPRVAVLIGGNSKTHEITPEIIDKMINQLQSLDASLMVTASRRTGEKNIEKLRENLQGENIFFWDGKGENPYFAMLAWAEHIIVSSDSVSMISDAATTGKPVHLIPLEGGSKRFERLYKHFQNLGAIRFFNGNLESWTYTPINDAQMIADEIRIRLGLSSQ